MLDTCQHRSTYPHYKLNNILSKMVTISAFGINIYMALILYLVIIYMSIYYAFLFNILFFPYGLLFFVDIWLMNHIDSLHWYQSFVLIPDFCHQYLEFLYLFRSLTTCWPLAILHSKVGKYIPLPNTTLKKHWFSETSQSPTLNSWFGIFKFCWFVSE